MTDTLRSSRRVRRRGSCQCDLCLALIKPGDAYVDSYMVDGNEAWARREHVVCNEAADWLIYIIQRHDIDAPLGQEVELAQDEFLSAVRDGWATFGPNFASLLNDAPPHVLEQWSPSRLAGRVDTHVPARSA